MSTIKPFTQENHINNIFYLQKIVSGQPWQNINSTVINNVYQPKYFTFNFTGQSGFYSTKSKIQFELKISNPANSVPNYAKSDIFIRDEFVPLLARCQFTVDNKIIGNYGNLSQDQLAYYQTQKQSTRIIDDLTSDFNTLDLKKWRKVGSLPEQNQQETYKFSFPFKRFFPHILHKQKYFEVKQQFVISIQFIGDPMMMFSYIPISPLQIDVQPQQIPDMYVEIPEGVNSSMYAFEPDGNQPFLKCTSMNMKLLLKKYLKRPSDFVDREQAYFTSSYTTTQNSNGNIVLQCRKYSDFHYLSLMNYGSDEVNLNCFNQSEFIQSQQIIIQRNSQQLIDAENTTNSHMELLDQFDTVSCRKENNNVTIFTDKHKYTGEISFNVNSNGWIYYGIRYYI